LFGFFFAVAEFAAFDFILKKREMGLEASMSVYLLPLLVAGPLVSYLSLARQIKAQQPSRGTEPFTGDPLMSLLVVFYGFFVAIIGLLDSFHLHLARFVQ
jgi:hypothetical protein